MKKVMKLSCLLITAFLFSTQLTFAQQNKVNNSSNKKTTTMKTFVIEREIPGAGKLTPEQLKAVSQKSCAVLQKLGSGIVWQQSYVTGNKLYCVYQAENEELIREHAKLGEFPCNSVQEVTTIISPKTAE